MRALGERGPLGDERLSDERRVKRYASAVARAAVRRLPSTSARNVGRLRYVTEDGPFEVYLVLERHIDASQRLWLRVRLPQRPNGRTGWVRRKLPWVSRLRAISLRPRSGSARQIVGGASPTARYASIRIRG